MNTVFVRYLDPFGEEVWDHCNFSSPAEADEVACDIEQTHPDAEVYCSAWGDFC